MEKQKVKFLHILCFTFCISYSQTISISKIDEVDLLDRSRDFYWSDTLPNGLLGYKTIYEIVNFQTDSIYNFSNPNHFNSSTIGNRLLTSRSLYKNDKIIQYRDREYIAWDYEIIEMFDYNMNPVGKKTKIGPRNAGHGIGDYGEIATYNFKNKTIELYQNNEMYFTHSFLRKDVDELGGRIYYNERKRILILRIENTLFCINEFGVLLWEKETEGFPPIVMISKNGEFTCIASFRNRQDKTTEIFDTFSGNKVATFPYQLKPQNSSFSLDDSFALLKLAGRAYLYNTNSWDEGKRINIGSIIAYPCFYTEKDLLFLLSRVRVSKDENKILLNAISLKSQSNTPEFKQQVGDLKGSNQLNFMNTHLYVDKEQDQLVLVIDKKLIRYKLEFE